MSIKIRKITLDAFGPFEKRQIFELGQINLFFGKNESGKSILVRSLVGTIFKTKKSGRQLPITASIEVEGLGSEILRFTSRSNECIEQYITGENESLINDLSRLCVVSEGNLTLDPKERNNITVDTLRGYFSDQNVRDKVLNRIKPNIRNSSLTPSGPIGKTQGEFQLLKKMEEELLALDSYLDKVNQQYAESRFSSLMDSINRAEVQLEQIIKAKIGKAWQLKQEIARLYQSIDATPIDSIYSAINLVKNIRVAKEKAFLHETTLQSFGNIEEDLAWCEYALEFLTTDGTPLNLAGKQNILFVAAFFILLTLIASIYFGQILIAVVSGIFLFVLFLVTNLNNMSGDKEKFHQQEIRKTFSEFTRRFNKKEPSLIDIQEMRERLNQDKGKRTVIEKQLFTIRAEIEKNSDELRFQLSKLGIPLVKDLDQLDNLLSEREIDRKKALVQVNQLNNDLRQMKLIDAEIYEIKVHRKYSYEEEFDLTNSMASQRQELGSLQKAYTDLLNEGKLFLGAIANNYTLNETLDSLRQKRQDLVVEIRQIKAMIIAGNLVNSYFERQIEKEEETINNVLAHSHISQYLSLFTEHYSGISFDGKHVIVRPDDLRLSDLSTGTQEQALLAIRFGILRHHLPNSSMFIILDDAFQHSDWDRRERLVDNLGYLAANDWQILYFSMDDHVRSLFETRLKPKFGEKYMFFELDNPI